MASLKSVILKRNRMNENEIAHIVVDCAIRVHKELGPGLLESAYEQYLSYKIRDASLFVEQQKGIPLIFNGIDLGIGYRADLLVAKKLIVEIKAVEALHEIHKAQVITYLKVSGCKLGLLINFNSLLLKDGIRRIINGII
jgi:GxxExxY protein